ncbi:aspartate/glutamate racemase family protein [soil metagenome]
MAAVGIVGGLGVGATVHYYEKIAAACKARGVVPDLVIAHADVVHGQSLVRENKLDALAAYLAGFIERMARAGAVAAAIPAVTPHICIRQLEPLLGVPLINIVDVLASELRSRGTKRVALMGSVFTVQGSLWGQLGGVEIVKPQPDEIAFIGQAYQRILDGRSDPADAHGLRRIAADLQRRDGVETILLAGTDLAVMFDEQSAGFPCLDVARLHIDAIVERLAT